MVVASLVCFFNVDVSSDFLSQFWNADFYSEYSAFLEIQAVSVLLSWLKFVLCEIAFGLSMLLHVWVLTFGLGEGSILFNSDLPT